jgi:hypothetical protein
MLKREVFVCFRAVGQTIFLKCVVPRIMEFDGHQPKMKGENAAN